MSVVIIPVGITAETVRGALRYVEYPSTVIAVTVPGLEAEKRKVLEDLRGASELLGAEFRIVVAGPDGVDGFATLYRILKSIGAETVYLVGYTGSRFLFAPLATVLLKYWRETRARIYLLHAVEGSSFVSIEPFPGYFATAMRFSSIQKRIMCLVYGLGGLSGKDLKERYGFTHSIYAVLRDMERKGLVRVRRNRIEPTYPGRLVYALLREDGECKDVEG